MHEGMAVRELLISIPALLPLCVHANNGEGVSEIFVHETLGQPWTRARFAILATRQGTPLGFVLCTVHSGYGSIRFPRIVSIDLICTQGNDPVRGLGSTLLQEVTTYAANTLGADLLVLESVTDPRTVRAYRRNGFVRGPSACTSRAVQLRKQSPKQAYRALLRENPGMRDDPDVLAALNGVYFREFNNLNNAKNKTVIFSKCLLQLRSNLPEGSATPRLRTTPNNYVNFLNSRRYVLRVYKLEGNRLVPPR